MTASIPTVFCGIYRTMELRIRPSIPLSIQPESNLEFPMQTPSTSTLSHKRFSTPVTKQISRCTDICKIFLRFIYLS